MEMPNFFCKGVVFWVMITKIHREVSNNHEDFRDFWIFPTFFDPGFVPLPPVQVAQNHCDSMVRELAQKLPSYQLQRPSRRGLAAGSADAEEDLDGCTEQVGPAGKRLALQNVF